MRNLLCTILLALVALAQAKITVDNFEPGTLVRYPVVTLRGTCPDSSIATGLDWKAMSKFDVTDGKFVAIVELKPGLNWVLLNAGRDTVKLRIDYKPMKTPYVMRAVYIVADDEDPRYDSPIPGDRQQYREKFDTALKLLQSFTAESMNDNGYGRKTFPLELDDNGKVVVHLLKHPKKGDELRAMSGNDLWSLFYGWLEPQFPMDVNKVCALMGFSRYEAWHKVAKGHTALGGGGLGVFGTASMYTWPAALNDIIPAFSNAKTIDPNISFDDTAYRGTYWASASTTMGAMLHEMGHTLGLPHSTDPQEIMSRGFDHLNRAYTFIEPPERGKSEPSPFAKDQVAHFSPVFAARLNWHPWFQPDGNNGGKFLTALLPTITLDTDKDTVTFNAPYGCRVIGTDRDGTEPACTPYPKDPAQIVVTQKLSELKAKMGTGAFDVYVIDGQGNEARVKIG